ncbi:CPCC family cysteine-rich protein [Sphingomonas cannabina]|uniref:CPCC family cysteine-rich protein n=1 Tax=Sphingomonas cannabina TaxID=2899123 RepID=UPI0038730CA8
MLLLAEISCPVCGKTALEDGDYAICDVCGWENDPSQIEHPRMSGANQMSLTDARVHWRATGKQVR